MTRFVIVGGGLAGHKAAIELRRLDPDASITLISEEAELPYDRTPLSKEILIGTKQVSDLTLSGAEDYAACGIIHVAGQRAIAIDRHLHTVKTDAGDTYGYDKLLIATGSRPRKLQVRGADQRIAYLRTAADALELGRMMAEGKHIAIVGAGFIGLEVAAAARLRGCRVTVLEAADRILARGMPDLVSTWMHALHTRRGVEIRLGCTLTGIQWASNEVMLTSSGSTLNADAVIAGIGVVPNLEVATKAGLCIENGLSVDAHCRTSDPDIFGAGEVTCHPVRPAGRHRVESWKSSGDHGVAAARSMVGKGEPFEDIPWLWSDQYDANIQTVGIPADAACLNIAGDPASSQWTIVGSDRRGVVVSGVTVNRGRDAGLLRRAVRDCLSLSAIQSKIGPTIARMVEHAMVG